MSAKNARLVGIKTIADYLDTSERNVYRWEKKFGLPLRRVAGSKGYSVYVYISELEEWLRQRESTNVQDKKNIRKIVSWGALIILTLIIVIVITVFIVNFRYERTLKSLEVSQNSPNPIFPSFEGNVVFIKNQDGENIWTYEDSDNKISSRDWDKSRCIGFLDIDKDGANEVIARKYDSSKDRYYLTLFDNDKKVLWQKHITNKQKFNGLSLESDFYLLDIKLAHLRDKSCSIVTHWQHRGRFLSLISSHNSKGELLSKYIHVGHLSSFKIHDLDGDGNEEIIFSGTNNLLNGEGVLGVLDLNGFKGVSPSYQVEPEYNHLAHDLKIYVPDNPEKGNQRAYLRFKRTHHLEGLQRVHIFAELDNIDGEVIHVQVNSWCLEFLNQPFGFLYVLDNQFKLKYVFANSPMKKYYPDLLAEGKIDIGLDELADICSKSLFYWENGGWITVSNE